MADTKNQSCLIAGASHAGVNAAFALRREGWEGRIALFDRDPEIPYHRPPLSKGFLLGETTVEERLLKAASSYAAEQIELRPGLAVHRILREEKSLSLTDGTTHSYDKLILATGASPFLPPISGLRGNDRVFMLRTAADARGIRKAFNAGGGKRVVVIGGGYIGLEAAASLRKLGGEVTVLEREDRILARVTSPEMSVFFTGLHRENGVNIVTGCNVLAIREAEGELVVASDNGSQYTADLIIVGVGVTVNTLLAEASGLKTSNGIWADSGMRTIDPDIYAIGDCASFHHPRYGREMRLESVQNAVDQAKVAAANICGKPAHYQTVPWFWSDQFNVKLQMCGLAPGYDRLVVRRETGADPYQRSVWYFSGGKLVAVDAVNHGRAYMLGMKLLKDDLSPDPEKLADPSLALHPKTILG